MIFFDLINGSKISTIIFSAEIYYLIYKFLNQTGNDYNYVHVVANIFEFREDKFVGTKGDIIHSQNKNFEELSHLQIYSELKNKKVCILLGDSIGDLKMVEGANFEEVLKICFLNKLPGDNQYEKRLKAHRENYDMVIDGMEDFSKINLILKSLIKIN